MSVLVALILAACPTAAPPTTAPFWLVEMTEGGKSTPYPEAAVVSVDINSSVDICLHSANLKGPTPVGPPSKLVTQLKDAKALVEELRQNAEAAIAALQIRKKAGNRKLTTLEDQQYVAGLKPYFDSITTLERYVVENGGDEDLLDEFAVTPGGSHVAGTAWLGEHIKKLERQLEHDVEGATTTLELSAFIGNPPAQVHLPGYDDLTPGMAQRVEKTKFVFDDAVKAEVAAAEDLAKSIKNFSDVRDVALRFAQQQLEKLVATLAEAEGEAATLDTVRIDDALKTSIKQVVADVRALVAQARGLLDVFNQPKLSPIDALARVVAGIQTIEAEAHKLSQSAQKLKNELNKKAVDIGRLVAALEHIIRLSEMIGRTPLSTELPTPRSIPIATASAANTSLSLLTTTRKDGDQIVIRSRIFNSEGKVVPGGEHQRVLVVETRGIVADVGASIQAVKPLLGNEPFAFAAGAFAVLRFTGWRNDNDADSPFFKVVAPGLGVAVMAIPTANDGSTRLAWMATLHLFSDILQVSIGVDMKLQTFWGVGFGLHRIAKLGMTIP